MGSLNASLKRKRITSKLGRTSYSSKKAREVVAMYAGDTQKADVVMAACRRHGRFFYDPSFPNDDSEACLCREMRPRRKFSWHGPCSRRTPQQPARALVTSSATYLRAASGTARSPPSHSPAIRSRLRWPAEVLPRLRQCSRCSARRGVPSLPAPSDAACAVPPPVQQSMGALRSLARSCDTLVRQQWHACGCILLGPRCSTARRPCIAARRRCAARPLCKTPSPWAAARLLATRSPRAC